MTLIEFLTARLDEDEEEARIERRAGMVGDAGWSPKRVLREVEAKRAILAEHSGYMGLCQTCADEEDSSEDSDGNREWYRGGKRHPCPTLRALAVVYADHPDYRDEWKP